MQSQAKAISRIDKQENEANLEHDYQICYYSLHGGGMPILHFGSIQTERTHTHTPISKMLLF